MSDEHKEPVVREGTLERSASLPIIAPKKEVVVTRLIKCFSCFEVIGRCVLHYRRGNYTVLEEMSEIPKEKMCKKCKDGLRGRRL